MKKRLRLTVLFLLFFTSFSLHAQLRFANLFTNDAVLQRGKPIPVWGWSTPGKKVIVKLATQRLTTTADKQGRWTVGFPAMPAGGPYELIGESGTVKIRCTNVAIGEVWLASGQSNMEWVEKDAQGYAQEKLIASNNDIRQLLVKHDLSATPLDDIQPTAWQRADSGTVGAFSAVAYHFAKKLAQQLGVTVGIVNSSWGGSQAESWMSLESMRALAELAPTVATMPGTRESLTKRADSVLRLYATGSTSTQLPDEKIIAGSPSSFFNTWREGSAPGAWEWQGKFYGYRGSGYMEQTIRLTATPKGGAILRLADCDASLQVYVNGTQVFAGDLLLGSPITIKEGLLHAGDNVLLLHLSQQKIPDWFGVGIPGNKQDLFLQTRDSAMMLARNPWRLMPDFAAPYHFQLGCNSAPTILYNAMIKPLAPFAFAGVIWYQGETNASRAWQYRETFPAMIRDWRKLWNSELPFYFVQLSSFGANQSSNEGSNWAELREAQTKTLSLPATGMAVTIDIGYAEDIHPKNKTDVGRRLAAAALHGVYRLSVVYSGPTMKEIRFEQNTAIVTFDNLGSGLLVKNKYGYVNAFEVAGANRHWHYARALVVNNTVRVVSDSVPNPVAVRYAWSDAPLDANLYNREGFPAVPFRSDDWPAITRNNKFE